MRLGLTNTIAARGTPVGGDGLALDLQFAADKTLTARKGPTPVLTRGSGATFVNSAGLIEYAPENLLLQSAGFSTGSWTKSGSTVTADSIASPDGTVTADLLNEDSGLSAHFAQQTVSASLNAGQAYTFSVFAKAGSHTSFQMTVSTLAFGSNLFANFVLTGAGSVGASNGVNTNIQSYDNGWYRCSITISSVGGGANGICIIASNNNNSSAARTPSYQGTGAQVVYLWGAQLETASTARTYNPTTTAAFYGPRFDHDPVTLASRGLLIEESRTNLYQRSENFADVFWTKTRSSIQSDATTAPDGTTTSDKLIEDTSASNTHVLQSAITPTATPHTLSVFAKKGERNFIVLRLGGLNDFFNLNTGVALTNLNAPTITNYGNGWYRCTVTSSAGTQGSFRISADGITDTYTGDGTSGIFIWGAQLEAGSFATSYIPTTNSSLQRSADVCSITNTAPFWNSSEFTILTISNIVNSGIDLYASNFQITSGFFGCRRTAANTITAIIRSSGVNADLSLGSFSTGSSRLAAAHITGQVAASFNGGAATQQSTAFVPSLNPVLQIGSSNGSSSIMNGHIAAIRYYRKRLPNAKLQALTV